MIHQIFVYNITVKLGDLPAYAEATFPDVTDLAVKSRPFNSYAECVSSAKQFMIDLADRINTHEPEKYTVTTEISKAHTGNATRSTGWEDNELARIWVFSSKQENDPSIRAACQARLFTLQSAEPTQLIN